MPKVRLSFQSEMGTEAGQVGRLKCCLFSHWDHLFLPLSQDGSQGEGWLMRVCGSRM